MPRLSAHLLGAPRLEVDGRATDLASAKALALLSFLLTSRQVHSRDRLAGFLWPDVPERNALASLRTALYEVRRALGDAASHFLEIDRHRVSFRADSDYWLDVAVVDAAEPERDDGEFEALQAAVAAYGGDFLSGVSLPDACDFDDWVFLERERLTQRHLSNLCRLGEHHASLGDYERAIETARAVLAVDPLREDVHRHLMAFHARAGQRAAALAAYRSLVGLLERELGIEPLEATTELSERIQSGAPIDDLGRGPEPVARAAARVASSAADAFAAARAARLTGRREELGRLRAAWQAASSGRREVVLVSGEAGIGKSCLVAEFAREIAHDAVEFVGRCHEATAAQAYAPVVQALRSGLAGRDLAELGLSGLWVREIARLLPELAPAGGESNAPLEGERERDRLFEAVGEVVAAAARKRTVLLVVDDCQWADETSLSLLAFLATRLAAAPLLLVLAYRSEELDSGRRGQLRRIGSVGQRIALPPLTCSETAELVASVSAADDDPVRFGRRIHRVTGGNPLFVLETLRAMVDQGTVRLDTEGWTTIAEAESDDYAGLPIPDSVAAIVDARLERLPDDARVLAECASALRRDFEFSLVHQLSSLPSDAALDSLDALLAQGLLREVPDSGTADEVRYDFAHALVRDRVYQSMSGARRQYLHRQVAGLIEASHPGSPDRIAYHYLRGGVRDRALAWSSRAGNAALSVYAGESALVHFRTALELAAAPVEERAALCGLGDAYVSLGRPADAIPCFEQALALPSADEQRAGLYRRIGRAHERQGDYDKALAAYDNARRLVRGRPSMVALQVADGLATVYVRLGRHAQAIGLCLDALAWLAENPGLEGAREAEAWIRNTLGMAYLHDGDYAPALRALERSLEIKRSVGDRQGEATLLNNLGALAYHCGEDVQARDYYAASLRIKEEIGDGYGRAIALTNLALIETHLGDHEAALARLSAAEQAAGAVGARWLLPEIKRAASQRALAVGDLETALACAEAELAAAEDLAVPAFIGAAHRMLGVVKAASSGDAEAALAHFETSVVVFEMLASDHELAKTHAAFGEALHSQGDDEAALPHLRQAAEVFERSGAHGRRRRLDPLLGH